MKLGITLESFALLSFLRYVNDNAAITVSFSLPPWGADSAAQGFAATHCKQPSVLVRQLIPFPHDPAFLRADRARDFALALSLSLVSSELHLAKTGHAHILIQKPELC